MPLTSDRAQWANARVSRPIARHRNVLLIRHADREWPVVARYSYTDAMSVFAQVLCARMHGRSLCARNEWQFVAPAIPCSFIASYECARAQCTNASAPAEFAMVCTRSPPLFHRNQSVCARQLSSLCAIDMLRVFMCNVYDAIIAGTFDYAMVDIRIAFWTARGRET